MIKASLSDFTKPETQPEVLSCKNSEEDVECGRKKLPDEMNLNCISDAVNIFLETDLKMDLEQLFLPSL